MKLRETIEVQGTENYIGKAKYIRVSRTVANTGYPRIERWLLSTMSKHLLGSKIARSGIGISVYKITILPWKNPIIVHILSLPSTTCYYWNNRIKRRDQACYVTVMLFLTISILILNRCFAICRVFMWEEGLISREKINRKRRIKCLHPKLRFWEKRLWKIIKTTFKHIQHI